MNCIRDLVGNVYLFIFHLLVCSTIIFIAPKSDIGFEFYFIILIVGSVPLVAGDNDGRCAENGRGKNNYFAKTFRI